MRGAVKPIRLNARVEIAGASRDYPIQELQMPTSCALQDDGEVYKAQIALRNSDSQCILYAKRHATKGKGRPREAALLLSQTLSFALMAERHLSLMLPGVNESEIGHIPGDIADREYGQARIVPGKRASKPPAE